MRLLARLRNHLEVRPLFLHLVPPFSDASFAFMSSKSESENLNGIILFLNSLLSGACSRSVAIFDSTGGFANLLHNLLRSLIPEFDMFTKYLAHFVDKGRSLSLFHILWRTLTSVFKRDSNDSYYPTESNGSLLEPHDYLHLPFGGHCVNFADRRPSSQLQCGASCSGQYLPFLVLDF